MEITTKAEDLLTIEDSLNEDGDLMIILDCGFEWESYTHLTREQVISLRDHLDKILSQ